MQRMTGGECARPAVARAMHALHGAPGKVPITMQSEASRGRVHAVDHTADLSIEIEAPSLESLFDLAARGMRALIECDDEDAALAALPRTPARRTSHSNDSVATRRIEQRADDLPSLLLFWLRELLHLHQVDGVGYENAAFEQLDERTLRANVHGAAGARVVRELKGVTYHDLAAFRRNHGWFGRVIFDV
jgi:SHS2 domain-containing protein